MHCDICKKPIEREPHLEVDSTKKCYHTCNINSNGNSCYQEWLHATKKPTTNDLCNMSPSNI